MHFLGRFLLSTTQKPFLDHNILIFVLNNIVSYNRIDYIELNAILVRKMLSNKCLYLKIVFIIQEAKPFYVKPKRQNYWLEIV